MIPVESCRGCHDDFYNGRDNIDGKRRCWSAEKATIITRYSIHYMTAPTEKGAFTKVRVPNCYYQVNQNVFFNELPSYVKASDLNRARRSP